MKCLILNLENLDSDLVSKSLINQIKLEEFQLPQEFQSQHLIRLFNTRYIYPQNLNQIIYLCDFIMLKNTRKFLQLNVEYIDNNKEEEYILNEYNSEHFPNLFPKKNQQYDCSSRF